jgi:HAD superfamily hydrolase (TIGR01509 family)
LSSAPADRPVAVLWDVGNVIVRWDPRRLYSRIFPDPEERDWFLGHVCTMAWHTEHDRGRSFAQGAEELVGRFPQYEDAIRAWRGRWWEMFDGPIAETEAAMRALAARRTPQHGLTNMSPEVWPGVQAMSDVFGLLQEVVVSGDERLVKPDPRIFALACERTGLGPSQLLFVDDNADNIAAAGAMGMVTIWFQDPAALRPELERNGLL